MSLQERTLLDQEIAQNFETHRNQTSATLTNANSRITAMFDTADRTNKISTPLTHANSIVKIETWGIDRGVIETTSCNGKTTHTRRLSANGVGGLSIQDELVDVQTGNVLRHHSVSVSEQGHVNRDQYHWDATLGMYVSPKTTPKEDFTALFYELRNFQLIVEEASAAPLN